jgi:hypothetical protein
VQPFPFRSRAPDSVARYELCLPRCPFCVRFPRFPVISYDVLLLAVIARSSSWPGAFCSETHLAPLPQIACLITLIYPRLIPSSLHPIPQPYFTASPPLRQFPIAKTPNPPSNCNLFVELASTLPSRSIPWLSAASQPNPTKPALLAPTTHHAGHTTYESDQGGLSRTVENRTSLRQVSYISPAVPIKPCDVIPDEIND